MSAGFDHRADLEHRLAKAIAARGLTISPSTFLDVLADVNVRVALTESTDRDFLHTRAGIAEEDFSDEAQHAIDLEIAANHAQAERFLVRDSYTAEEVSTILHLSLVEVGRLADEGALHAVAISTGERRFPRWQLTDEGVLPGLKEILRALPNDYHPLEIAQFMAEPCAALGDSTPAEWLSKGDDVASVIALAEGRSWE